MFKTPFVLFSCLLALLLTGAGCNKDEDIVIEYPDSDGQSGQFTVVEYLPAPGQFINDKGAGMSGISNMEEACDYAQKRLESLNFVSLGAFGGSLTVKASSPVANTGGYEFAIAGNSFDSSNEPGIVWVMQDSNGNGLADDTWYELRGSYFGKEGYERDYSVTYFRPASADAPVRWTDSNGVSGELNRNQFHSQPSYFPEWVDADSYTLTGSRLPGRAQQDPATGVWKNLPFEWGYVDNSGEDSALKEIDGQNVQLNYFRISDAIDASGNPVALKSVDFIKVQTAVNAQAGVIGEVSTEVCGFFRN